MAIAGASGGVGSAAIQLCRLRGAWVIAIAAAAKAYRAFYQRVDLEDSAAGYLMNHSTFTYFMMPDGIRGLFKNGHPPEEMVGEKRDVLEAVGQRRHVHDVPEAGADVGLERREWPVRRPDQAQVGLTRAGVAQALVVALVEQAQELRIELRGLGERPELDRVRGGQCTAQEEACVGVLLVRGRADQCAEVHRRPRDDPGRGTEGPLEGAVGPVRAAEALEAEASMASTSSMMAIGALSPGRRRDSFTTRV